MELFSASVMEDPSSISTCIYDTPLFPMINYWLLENNSKTRYDPQGDISCQMNVGDVAIKPSSSSKNVSVSSLFAEIYDVSCDDKYDVLYHIYRLIEPC